MPPAEHPLSGFFPLPKGQIFAWVQYQGRELLLIEHSRCRAAFSRQGGQLLHFQPSGERPLLWCMARWPKLGAIRGGVVLCWPWFGRHPQQNGWPAHGWARLADWTLEHLQADAEGVRLTWGLELCDWQARLEVELGDGMHLCLSTRHQDSEPCLLSHALQAYWRVADVARVRLFGLEGLSGTDRQSGQIRRCMQPLRAHPGIERLYRHRGSLTLHDPLWARGLHIGKAHSSGTLVLHPGRRVLDEIGFAEARRLLCVGVTAGENHDLSLVPGQQACLELRAGLE